MNVQNIGCRGKRISRKDVTIPWRPVFDLYCKLLFKEDERPINVEGLHDVIIGLREMFPLTATKEILDEVRIAFPSFLNAHHCFV